MIISKKVIVLGGILCIFIFALLNRVNVIQKSEKTDAYAQRIWENDDTQYYLFYTYRGIPYTYVMENDVSLKNHTTYTLLIKNGNPEDFLVYNFIGFWFIALLIACVIVSGWVLFSQVFFDNIVRFKFSFFLRKGKVCKVEKISHPKKLIVFIIS